MYSVLIKDAKTGMFRFFSVKQEIMKQESQEVIDPETNEVRTEVTQVPTGKFETVRFETDARDILEKKCIELLNTYNTSDFIPINTEPFDIDFVWNGESV